MKPLKWRLIIGSSIFIRIYLFYIKFSPTALSLGKSACDSPQSGRLQGYCLEILQVKNGHNKKQTQYAGRKEQVCCYQGQESHVSFKVKKRFSPSPEAHFTSRVWICVWYFRHQSSKVTCAESSENDWEVGKAKTALIMEGLIKGCVSKWFVCLPFQSI